MGCGWLCRRYGKRFHRWALVCCIPYYWKWSTTSCSRFCSSEYEWHPCIPLARKCQTSAWWNHIPEVTRKRLNTPFPSSKKSHLQSEAKCEAIDMKMIFNYDANKTHFHNKGFALSLVLKVRFFGTRKCPIKMKREEKWLRHVAMVANFGWQQTKNVNSHCFKLHRFYSISFNLSNVRKFSRVKSERTVSKLRKRKKILRCARLLRKAGAWS